MKKHTLFFITVVALLSLFTQPSFSQDTMTIAVHDYAPYYNSEGKGLMIDVYKAAGAAADIDVTLQVLPVKRAIEYLFQNKVDAFSPGHIFMTPDQVKQVSLIKTFNVNMIFLYYDPGAKKNVAFKSLADLVGKKVGIVVNSPMLDAYKQAGLTFEEVQTPEMLVKMLRAGRFEFVEGTLLTGMSLINQLFKDEMKDFNYVLFGDIECSLAFNNANPNTKALMDKFNKGFETIKSNGEYIRIHEQYWGKNNIQKQALTADLIKYGVDKASFDVFNSYKRNAWGKIEGE